ncbi:TIGR03089 family protein [Corynebacterium sp. ES2715-CONJ3]|uniref:TIGR03089 family protein n=1 Tax=Corynebacterium sp. ES2715-CONJ3 TaxID=2974028 RepID=UPI002169DEF7|nr:TIGR03089 family protein [Corynebacterium sp. ES2715-CONJ3]MCS4491492.1 TIGR03089 family protein [Corynebacterium sp. ES2715-CONJ3]
MPLLSPLITANPAIPRLSTYDETTGARLDFSAQTLDNWANKVANMLIDELDLNESETIGIALPSTWQAVCIALGSITASIPYRFLDPHEPFADPDAADVIFAPPRSFSAEFDGDIVLVTNDPFGRGVKEIGSDLPEGAIDFGPTVRYHGDSFSQPSPDLKTLAHHTIPHEARVLSRGWKDAEGFNQAILSPFAALGSVVLINGLVSAERLAHIRESEKVSLDL